MLHDDMRQYIKAQIVDVMARQPPKIQSQLADVIAIIGKHDFPLAWPSLLVRRLYAPVLCLCTGLVAGMSE